MITQTHYEDIRFYQTIWLTKLHTKKKKKTPIKENLGKTEKERSDTHSHALASFLWNNLGLCLREDNFTGSTLNSWFYA